MISMSNVAFDWLERRSVTSPDKEAIVDLATGRRFTYRQFNERANRLANGWRKKWGIEKGDRIAILAKNSPAHLEGFYAAGKLGAILVPVNIRLAIEELVWILEDCAPKGLILGEEYLSVLPHLKGKIDIPYFLSLDGATDGGIGDYEEFLSSSENQTPALEAPNTLNDPIAILYTSGTMGLPKGAVLSQGNIFYNALNMVLNDGEVSFETVNLCAVPFFHTGGLNSMTNPTVFAGGTNVIMKVFDPGEALRLLDKRRYNSVFLVATMWRFMFLHEDFEKTDFSDMKIATSGGEALPVPMIDTLYHKKGIVLNQGYGLTESGPVAMIQSPSEGRNKPGSTGRPVFYMDVRLVNNDGVDVPVGEVGEILLHGPSVIREYWNNSEATAAAFNDGWFCTGDLAYMDEEGYYYIKGRKKEMVISGGENIYPAEVERVISQNSKIAEVAVFGVPNAKWGEICHAVVCAKQGETITEEELLDYLQDKLSRYKIPKRFSFMDVLPKGSTGKVLKRALQETYSKQR